VSMVVIERPEIGKVGDQFLYLSGVFRKDCFPLNVPVSHIFSMNTYTSKLPEERVINIPLKRARRMYRMQNAQLFALVFSIFVVTWPGCVSPHELPESSLPSRPSIALL
jgi:hypothetical protein